MKTTLAELSQLFKLKSNEYRQLKIGLVNKIHIIDANNVEVTDEGVKNLLTQFKEGGAYTVKEVCSIYKISLHKLLEMVEQRVISSYQLKTSKGSRLLFLKSEIEKETEVLLVHTPKGIGRESKLSEIGERLLNRLKEFSRMTDKEYKIVYNYYFTTISIEEIAKENEVSVAEINKFIGSFDKHILLSLLDFLQQNEKYEETIINHRSLEAKCDELESIINSDPTLLLKKQALDYKNRYIRFRNVKITDVGLDSRTVNCLKSENINTLEDMLKKRRHDLLKLRNFGKKSLEDVDGLIARMKIQW